MSQAQSTLKAAGFQVNVQTDNNSTGSPGTVVKQDPTAGTKAKFGSTVTIFVPPSGSLVPAVVGDDYQVALGKLSNAGFSNINVVNVTNPNVPNGTVPGPDPACRTAGARQYADHPQRGEERRHPQPDADDGLADADGVADALADRHRAVTPRSAAAPIWSPLTGATVPGSN